MKSIKKSLSTLLAAAITVSALAVGLFAYGSDSVAITSANFPDANWRTVVSKVYDTDSDGYLSADESNVTSLTVAKYLSTYCGDSAEITDLTGIEHFSSLSRLYCGYIGLQTLDVSSLSNLTQLYCQGNELTALTLGSVTALEKVNCRSNELTSLDTSGCTALTTLDCSANNITSLAVTSNTALTSLICYQNELSSLNLKGLYSLSELKCSNNHLAELDLSTNASLGETLSNAIGSQTIEASMQMANGSLVASYSFSDSDGVVSTSFDTINSDDGTTVLGFNNGMFVTDDASKILDGIYYQYDTGNSAAEYMQVHVDLTRNFHVVRFYQDSDLETLLGVAAVADGDSATVPEFETPSCKTFNSWSDSYDNVTSDIDIYAVWDVQHTYEFVAMNDDATLDVQCMVCGIEDTIDFMYTLNSAEGDSNYISGVDVVSDGFINAKDYAKLYSQLKNSSAE